MLRSEGTDIHREETADAILFGKKKKRILITQQIGWKQEQIDN